MENQLSEWLNKNCLFICAKCLQYALAQRYITKFCVQVHLWKEKITACANAHCHKKTWFWSYIWYGLKFIWTIYIIYMLRRRNLTSSYLRNRGASRHRMRSPNFQSAKLFLTLLNNVKVSQAKLIFEEKINLSYIHIKIKVWRYPYLSQFFRK